MAKSIGLGRGLAAVLGDDAEAFEKQVTTSNDVSIDLIDPNPWQPRTEFGEEELEELAMSISNIGIIQPLTLRHLENGRYQIIAGERRFRAAKQAGLTSVPAFVRDVEDDSMLEMALVENIQRSDLNPIEEALSYARLIDECHLTQETMADRVGKKRSTVTNYLRLLKLPAEIQDGLKKKLISMGHARAIMGIDDEETQLMLFHETVEQGYSVRKIEEYVREYNDPQPSSVEGQEEQQGESQTQPNRQVVDSDYRALDDKLSTYFSTKVKISRNTSGKGKITISFAGDDDLLRIMEILDKAN